MIVRWQIEDGYCGGSRPQETEIDDDELNELKTDEEKEKFIEECIQFDFEQNISWVRID